MKLKVKASAVARVSNPLPPPASCRCGGAVRLANNSEVYGESQGYWPFVYICHTCRAYVGLHPHTDIPLGTLADATTRLARQSAKAAFNPLWQSGGLPRSQAYDWLAAQLGMPVEQCHFGWFDADTCYLAMAIIDNYVRETT